LSIVRVLAPPVDDIDTVAALFIVRVLMVTVALISIVALISMTTSCAAVGTAFNDQLPAVLHALSPAVPVQVFVVCPSAPGMITIFPTTSMNALSKARPVAALKKKAIGRFLVFIDLFIV
jgi:hypothetical protein